MTPQSKAILDVLSSSGEKESIPILADRDFTPVQTGQQNIGFVLSGTELDQGSFRLLGHTTQDEGGLRFIQGGTSSVGVVTSSVPEGSTFGAAAILCVLCLAGFWRRNKLRS